MIKAIPAPKTQNSGGGVEKKDNAKRSSAEKEVLASNGYYG